MSLDVYLNRKFYLSYDEGKTYVEKHETIYTSNITHNLGKMADRAGIYYALWRPEEIGRSKAGEIIDFLKSGINRLKEKPDYFRKFNAPNGWGLYEHLLKFAEDYLCACIANQEAAISVSR